MTESNTEALTKDERAVLDIDAWAEGAKFALRSIASHDICFLTESMRLSAVKLATNACVEEKERLIEARAALTSDVAQAPIYQISDGADWSDTDWLEYQSTPAQDRRIVYAAPVAPTPETAPLDFKNALTPYGMLVRALRIVADTTLYDMAKALSCSPAMLSSIEFGRDPIADAMIADAAAYFSDRGIPDTLHALRAALAATAQSDAEGKS